MMRNEHGELVSFVFIDNKDIGDCRLCKTWRKKLLMKKQISQQGIVLVGRDRCRCDETYCRNLWLAVFLLHW